MAETKLLNCDEKWKNWPSQFLKQNIEVSCDKSPKKESKMGMVQERGHYKIQGVHK